MNYLFQVEVGNGIRVSKVPIWKETTQSYFLSEDFHSQNILRKKHLGMILSIAGIVDFEMNKLLKPSGKIIYCYHSEYIAEVHRGGANSLLTFLSDSSEIPKFVRILKAELELNLQYNLKKLTEQVRKLQEISYYEVGVGGFNFFELNSKLERIKELHSKTQDDYISYLATQN